MKYATKYFYVDSTVWPIWHRWASSPLRMILLLLQTLEFKERKPCRDTNVREEQSQFIEPIVSSNYNELEKHNTNTRQTFSDRFLTLFLCICNEYEWCEKSTRKLISQNKSTSSIIFFTLYMWHVSPLQASTCLLCAGPMIWPNSCSMSQGKIQERHRDRANQILLQNYS